MGRSAKLHKRVVSNADTSQIFLVIQFRQPKKPKLHGPGNPMSNAQSAPQSQAQKAKKRATIKGQVGARKSGPESGEGVLGGADYVALMTGGRRKARQEVEKLSRGESS